MKKRYLDCKYLDAGMDGMLCSMDLCTTCKRFNGENCSNYVSKTTMNNNNEIPKENQIYDIAKIIFERGVALDGIDFAYGLVGSDHFDRIARAIYNAGYRNCKETASVIYKKGKELDENFDMTGLGEYIIANFLSKENENER